jgi:hypothetical protein
MPEEMKKLRKMLTAMSIKWHDKSTVYEPYEIVDHKILLNLCIYRTHFNYKGKFHSVICGYGTYGGQEGLLEMMIGNNDPSGWHTAEDIIKILKGEQE